MTINPHITAEVFIWTFMSIAGLIVSYLSLREIGRNEDSLKIVGTTTPLSIRLIRKDRINESLRGLAQLVAFLAGMVAIFFSDPVPNSAPVSQTGEVILYMLIGFELILVINSLQEYLTNRATVHDQMVDRERDRP